MDMLKLFEKVGYLPRRTYKSMKVEDLDPSKEDEVWTAKIDGAHSIIRMMKNRLPKIYSHRFSKRTGEAIPYNEKLPQIKKKSPVTAEVRAEVYGVDNLGNAVAPETIAGILNSKPERALQTQKDLGIKMKAALIDLDTLGRRKVEEAPYSMKRKMLEAIAKMDPDFTLPEKAESQEAKERLLARIKSGEHPQTREGLVVHKLLGEREAFIKAKLVDDHDVYVRKVFREEAKKPDREPMAGGFHYSWSPEGPVVGRIGTGFDHTLKKDMLENPEKYVGRVARVQAQKKSTGGILQKPSFLGWHIDKNIGSDVSKVVTQKMKRDHDYKKQTVIINKKFAPNREAAKELARRWADRIYTARESRPSYRFRQLNPDRFDKSTFRTFKPAEGVSVVYGKLLPKE